MSINTRIKRHLSLHDIVYLRCNSNHHPNLTANSKFFESVEDTFELQRGLNNCFAYDLVPGAAIVESALKAARRLNDYPTAVRIFEGLKEKVENKSQYQAYLDEFASLRKELGE